MRAKSLCKATKSLTDFAVSNALTKSRLASVLARDGGKRLGVEREDAVLGGGEAQLERIGGVLGGNFAFTNAARDSTTPSRSRADRLLHFQGRLDDRLDCFGGVREFFGEVGLEPSGLRGTARRCSSSVRMPCFSRRCGLAGFRAGSRGSARPWVNALLEDGAELLRLRSAARPIGSSDTRSGARTPPGDPWPGRACSPRSKAAFTLCSVLFRTCAATDLTPPAPGRVADDARGPLGDGEKAFEGLARLLDAALGEVAQIVRDLKRGSGQSCLP